MSTLFLRLVVRSTWWWSLAIFAIATSPIAIVALLVGHALTKLGEMWHRAAVAIQTGAGAVAADVRTWRRS
jgi:hypothetical protein